MVDLGNQLGIEDLNAEDINEAIEFDGKELTNEDIYYIPRFLFVTLWNKVVK